MNDFVFNDENLKTLEKFDSARTELDNAVEDMDYIIDECMDKLKEEISIYCINFSKSGIIMTSDVQPDNFENYTIKITFLKPNIIQL